MAAYNVVDSCTFGIYKSMLDGCFTATEMESEAAVATLPTNSKANNATGITTTTTGWITKAKVGLQQEPDGRDDGMWYCYKDGVLVPGGRLVRRPLCTRAPKPRDNAGKKDESRKYASTRVLLKRASDNNVKGHLYRRTRQRHIKRLRVKPKVKQVAALPTIPDGHICRWPRCETHQPFAANRKELACIDETAAALANVMPRVPSPVGYWELDMPSSSPSV